MIKQSTILRTSAAMFFTCSGSVAYAQAQTSETIQLDTLTKVIGVALTLGGFFMGYMQMRMANKIAEVEAKFNQALHAVEQKLNSVQKEFTSIIHAENEKQNDKLQIGLKDLQNKMVTVHDMNGLKQIMALQYEALTERLKTAAGIYKKDNDK